MITVAHAQQLLEALSQRVDPTRVEQVRRAAQRGQADEATLLISRCGRNTRTAAWVALSKSGKIDPQVISDMIQSQAVRMSDQEQGLMLGWALAAGQATAAKVLILAGAPCGPIPQSATQERQTGPLACLVYGEYPRLAAADVLDLAIAMMERDHHALTRFNPGLVREHDVLCAFLDRAPHPQDQDGWAPFVWGPDGFARGQVSSDTDPRNSVELLQRDFPGIPIDLFVRAIAARHPGHARALLDLAGDALPTLRCDGLESAMDLTTEQPVLAAGFWHALADVWASTQRARQTNGWSLAEAPDIWPDEDILQRLRGFAQLDPEALDENNQTPAQRAYDIVGHPGPVAEVASQALNDRLELNTTAVVGPERRGARL